MSFSALSAFEDVYTTMQAQLALLTMFVDTFATKGDAEDLSLQIFAQTATFLNAAALMHDLASTACKAMDAAIVKAYKERTGAGREVEG